MARLRMCMRKGNQEPWDIVAGEMTGRDQVVGQR